MPVGGWSPGACTHESNTKHITPHGPYVERISLRVHALHAPARGGQSTRARQLARCTSNVGMCCDTSSGPSYVMSTSWSLYTKPRGAVLPDRTRPARRCRRYRTRRAPNRAPSAEICTSPDRGAALARERSQLAPLAGPPSPLSPPPSHRESTILAPLVRAKRGAPPSAAVLFAPLAPRV